MSTVDIATLALRVDALEVKAGTKALGELGTQAGKTEKEVSHMSKSASAAFTAMAASVRTIAGSMVALAGTGFALKHAVDEAQRYQNALNGLAAVARYAGADITKTMTRAATLTVDGMLSVNESATALKNLLSRGFSTDQAVEMINRFKDSAAFGKQASLEFGQAVVSATEGIKNENSILVDNAGVTKNVSVMWKEYAASINKGVQELTLAEKRQAEYNGILRETEAQVGNAALAAQGMTGATARMDKAFNDTAVTIGQTFMPAAIALTNALTGGLTFAVDNGVKPFLFMFENIGITAGEIMAKMGVFGDYLSSPSRWLNPAKAQKEMEAQFKIYADLAEQMRLDVAKRLDGAVSPQLGKDSGARRKDIIAEAKDVEDAAKKRIKALADEQQAARDFFAKNNDEMMAAQREQASELKKQLESGREAYAKYWQEVENATAKTVEQAKELEFQNSLIGKTADEIYALTSAREQETIAQHEAILATQLANDASDAEIQKIALQIEALYRLKTARGEKVTLEAAQENIKKETKAWEDMFKKVDDFAHDAFLSIFDKGKNAFEEIGTVIKKSILEMLYKMTLQKWIFQIGVAGGGSMAAGAEAAMPGVKSGGGILDSITGAGIGSIASGVSAAMEMGVVNGFSAGLTSMFSGGASAYSAGLMMPMVGIGLAAGAMLYKGLSMGPKVAGATSLQGQFGAGGFAGQYETPWTQKGGFLRRNRSGVDVSGLGGAQAGLSGMVGGTASIFTGLASVAGVATRSLDDWTFAINRQVSTQEQQKQLSIDLADSMGKHVLPMLEAFRQAGESLADTASRLTVEVVTLNQFYSQLGVVTRATIQDADALATSLGGIANATQLMNSFIKSFAPTSQVISNSLNTLAAAGIAQAEFFTTTEQWWAFMQSASLEQKTAMLANQGAIQDYIGAMDKSRTAIVATIQALKDQSIAAYDAARSMVDGLRQFATSVRDLQRSLWLGAQSPVMDRAGLTRAEFVSVNTAAAGGDVIAQGRLASSATAYLDAAKMQAASAEEYATSFAFVQSALSDTALTTDAMATTAERQLEELVQANIWLSALDEKNRLQNNSLEYLLTASVEASNAARQAVVTQAIADAMDSIARAVISAGGTFSAGGVTQTTGASGATALSYTSGYTTYQASVGATGAVSSVGAVLDPVAKAAADAAASAQRAATKQEALDAYNAEQQQYLQAKAASDALWASYYSTQQAVLQQGGGVDAYAYLNSNFYNPAAAASATTEQELAQAQAAYAAYQSLPSFAVGANEIPTDMIAQVHAGEEITPRPYVDLERSNRNDTNKLLGELTAEVIQLRRENQAGQIAIERNTNKSAKMTDRWEAIGMPVSRTA